MIRLLTLYVIICGIRCLVLGRCERGSLPREIRWPGSLPPKFHPLNPQLDTDLPPFHKPSLQSPINIATKKVTPIILPDLEFRYLLNENVLINMINTGTTVEFEIADSSVMEPIVFGGPLIPYGEFGFSNLHIHWGAEDRLGGEHKINKKRFAIEGHCVHFNRKYGTIEEAKKFSDGLAVIAFFGKIGPTDNPNWENIINELPNVRFPHTSVTLRANESLGWLAELGKPKGYFTYPGSLTTPPYSENVVWILYPTPVPISSLQVDKLRNLLSKDLTSIEENVRPIQKLNGRPVLYAL